MRALVLLLLCCLLGAAQAARVTIATNPDEPSSLELRNVTLPGGEAVQYYVVTGRPVTVTIDDTTVVEAEEIEIDLTNRLVRINGYGAIRTPTETVAGEDLTFDLSDETFRGSDVIIVTEAIDVLGVDANRVPGQISVVTGRFSPCSRCGQQTEDFGFRARRLELYPGDRLVALEVTVVIRDFPVFYLPLLVVPLGPPDRQPRFSITSGTATSRAEVALDWPYVSGGAALGTALLRYYADVVPGEGNALTNALLGGRTRESYLGGGFEHRFFTETGAGGLEVFYTPAFVQYGQDGEPVGRTRDAFAVRFRYDTDAEVTHVPQVNVLYERDDGARQRISEYSVRLASRGDGLRAIFTSRGFYDHEPGEGPSEPGYGEPRRTLARLELAPETDLFTVGPLSFSNLLLDVGVFEGRASPSARAFGVTSALRLLARQNLSLQPVTPWPGLEVSGRSDFLGQYYSGGQRLVDWNTDLTARQNFGVGLLNLRFTRDISEGETPFRFDAIGLGNVISLAADLQFTPFPWLRFTTSEVYTFLDERRPDQEGPGPLRSRLALFENVPWITFALENTWDIREGDPGTLAATLELRAPEPRLDARLRYRVVQDLLPEPNRVGGGLMDETSTDVELRFGVRPVFDLTVRGGYRFEPPLPETPGGVRDFWRPLELVFVFGTLDAGDGVPGLQLTYERDLNRSLPRRFRVDAGAELAPFSLTFTQTFDFLTSRVADARFGATWRGVATLELSGVALIPPQAVGLELDETATQTSTVNLFEDRSDGGAPRWRVSYSVLYDPTFTNLEGGLGGFRNRQLELRVNLEETQLGGVYYRLDLNTTFLLADDARAFSYLANTDLAFFVDIVSTVGLQATLRYNAFPDAEGAAVGRATLDLANVAATVRLFDQLYVSAILEQESWVLASPTPVDNAFNFQPVFQVVWDRCCWALYGRWDTRTGGISITLTTPGGTEGFRQEFATPLTLPGRGRQ